MNTHRFQWVDIAKGIGIMLVVYGHVMRGLHSSAIIDEQTFYFSDTLVYSFHMPLFFVLSGLFFRRSVEKYSPKRLIAEKCKTLLYPYIMWSVLQTCIEIILSNFTNGREELNSLFTCLFIPRAQFWFLFALFFINMLNILLYCVLKHKWLIISIIIGLTYYLFPVPLFVFSKTLQYLIFFNLGVLVSDNLLNGKFLKIASKLLFVVVSILVFIIVEYLMFTYTTNSVLSLIAAFTGVLLFLQISYKLHIYSFYGLSKLLNSTGNCSFEIYIFHILITAGILILLNNFFGVQNIIIHITSGTLCGIFIPFIITHLFNDKKWFKNLFRLP